MNSVQDVREYLDAVISGRRRPFSLVDNVLAFACLVDIERLIRANSRLHEIDYDHLKLMLTEKPAASVDLDLYRQMQQILIPRFEDL